MYMYMYKLGAQFLEENFSLHEQISITTSAAINISIIILKLYSIKINYYVY